MPKIGEIMICQFCGDKIIRTNTSQKYCDGCKAEARRIKKAETDRRRRAEIKESKPLKECICRNCHTIFTVKYKRMYCEDCAKEVHLKAVKENNKRIQEEYKKSESADVVNLKSEFTLAEVNAAARKNDMTYGQYVYQWKIGNVEPPDKLPESKKKRGRKK